MKRRECWPMLASACLALLAAHQPAPGGEPHPLDQRPQPWLRRQRPILSALVTKQSWCKVVLYSPHVIRHDGKFRMWYLGTSTATRTNDIVMGYAESDDGLNWNEYKNNPILTGKDVPWGHPLQTPFVLYDKEERVFKMWFVSGKGIERDGQGRVIRLSQHLGYAISKDGIQWKVHPKPIYPSGRSPSVIKEGPNRYRMWMGSSPSAEHKWNDIYKNIYEFTSTDGIRWKRSDQPIIRPTGKATTTIYPFVLKEGDRYFMWYGCHMPSRKFEIVCATSMDGTKWNVNHEQPAFPPAGGKTAFDGRYTSTPCVVSLPEGYLLYYSARDWKTEYVDGKGRTRTDRGGVYAHIGVARIDK